MKNRIMISAISALVLTSTLYAGQTGCEKVPVGLELAQALKSQMYDEAEMLLEIYKLEITNYRDQCDSSQEMFEQTQIDLLTYEDKLFDLKEDIKSLKSDQAINCIVTPNHQKLAKAFKSGNENEIIKSYEIYTMNAEQYLNHCTSHDDYIVVFEEVAFYDDYYNKWKKGIKLY